mgnify:FL=1
MGFFDDITGKTAAKAAKEAAALQFGREQQAVSGMQGAGGSYASGMEGLSQKFSPYADAGKPALERLMAGLGLGGNQEQFTNAYQSLPGYQSGMDAGSKAVTSRLNAGPGVQSGAAMKELQRFGSDYENQRVGDYLQRLMGLSGMGQTATGQQVATAGQGLGGKLGADLTAYGSSFKSAGTEPLGMVAGANARAAGSQNLLNTGTNIFGKIMGSFGGGGF